MHELALLRAKYTPDDAESDKYTILDKILGKDKYLRLAYYLEQNRNDWNDGYNYAETGLDGFTAETDEDKRIVETLQETIRESDYVDGRVFRDSWPTYGDLYGKVEDATLLSDLEKANKHFNLKEKQMSNYILELCPEQIDPILVSALKESIINERTNGSDLDNELLSALDRVLRYFTCQGEYISALQYIEDAIEEIEGE